MRRAALATLALSLLSVAAAPCCRAGSVTVDNIGLDEGNTTSLLEATSQYYVDAMRALIGERYKDEYSAIRWEILEGAMKEAQVARLEYRFVVNGEKRIRVYHALGGRPLGTMARFAFEGPTPAVTPSDPFEPTDEAWTTTSSPSASAEAAEFAAVDAGDSVFYTGFNETNIRSRILPRTPSALEPFPVEGVERAWDPEFKALRAIEHDIQTNIVPRGGSVRGITGGSTCGSCRHAMQAMAKAYDIDIHLTQMFGSLPRAEREALLSAGTAKLRGTRLVSHDGGRPLLARDVLFEARELQVRRHLNPSSLQRSFKGIPWRPRSFRLGTLPLPRIREASSESEPASPNADATELSPPPC